MAAKCILMVRSERGAQSVRWRAFATAATPDADFVAAVIPTAKGGDDIDKQPFCDEGWELFIDYGKDDGKGDALVQCRKEISWKDRISSKPSFVEYQYAPTRKSQDHRAHTGERQERP